MRIKWTPQKVECIINDVHNNTVSLVFSTFKSLNKKATFIDLEFGEWESSPYNVMKGSSHPKRAVLKRKKTNLKKYGHECNLNSKEGIDKKQKTWLKNYGTDNPSKSKHIKKKKEDTLLKNFGVKHIMHSKTLRSKIENTNLKRYGVSNPLQSKEIQKRANKTLIENYNVSNAFHTPKARKNWKSPKTIEKILMSFKKNFKFNTSKPEEKISQILNKIFINIDRQHIINGWAIDFYIKDIDLYLQIDGVYWHGLNRDLDEIKKFKTKRDVIIYKKYQTDIKQNEWFSQQNKCLMRITDKQIKMFSDNELYFFLKHLNKVKYE